MTKQEKNIAKNLSKKRSKRRSVTLWIIWIKNYEELSYLED